MTTKHGMSRTPLYVVWKAMHARCRNPKRASWKYYGNRGIKVCERWKDFMNFHEDMATGYEKGLMLDRIDNDGDYEPNNTRWTTASVSNQNKSNAIKEAVVTEIARVAGVSANTIYQRRDSGWPVERWTEPLRRRK